MSFLPPPAVESWSSTPNWQSLSGSSWQSRHAVYWEKISSLIVGSFSYTTNFYGVRIISYIILQLFPHFPEVPAQQSAPQKDLPVPCYLNPTITSVRLLILRYACPEHFAASEGVFMYWCFLYVVCLPWEVCLYDNRNCVPCTSEPPEEWLTQRRCQ